MKEDSFIAIALTIITLVALVAWPALLLLLRAQAFANRFTNTLGKNFLKLPSWTLSPLVFDVRSLALFRIALGFVTMADLVGRGSDMEAFFTDDGIFPRSAAAQKDRFALCLNMLSGGITLQWVIFIACGILAALFAVGYRTRITTPVLWIFVISIHNRNNLLNNSGDVLMALLVFICIFLPVGACYSVDAALCPSPKKQKDDENDKDDQHPYGVIGGGNLFLILQMIFVYWISYIYKIRSPLWWKDLTAVDLALRSDHVASTAQFLLDRPYLTRILTWWTIVLEAVIIWFPLIPIKNNWFRTFTILCYFNLHFGFKIFLDIGLFWLICIVGWTAMIPVTWWDFATRWLWQRKNGQLENAQKASTLLYNSSRPLNYKVALLLRTFVAFDQAGQNIKVQQLGGAHSIHFEDCVVDATEEGCVSVPESTSTQLRKNGNGHQQQQQDHQQKKYTFDSINIAIVHSTPTGSSTEVYNNWDAVVYLFRTSPVLFPLRAVVDSGIVRKIVGVKPPKGVNVSNLAKQLDNLLPIRKTSPKYLPTYLGFLACCLTGTTVWMNLADTHIVPPLPKPVAETMLSLQLRQFWGMFALPGPQATGWYVIPATRANGEVVDIYKHAMKPVSWEEPAFTASTFESEFWRKYFTNLRIYKHYHPIWLNYAQYMCRTINEPLIKAGHPELRVKNFTITFMLRKAEPFKFAAPQKVAMWEHYCFGPIPKSQAEIDSAKEAIRQQVRQEALAMKPGAEQDPQRDPKSTNGVIKPKLPRISVSKSAIRWAKKAIKAYEEEPKDASGTVTVEGSIVDITSYNSAKDLLATYGHLVK